MLESYHPSLYKQVSIRSEMAGTMGVLGVPGKGGGPRGKEDLSPHCCFPFVASAPEDCV